MKKTILSLLAIAAVAFAFTACSDVPVPEGYSTDPNAHGGSGGGGAVAGDGTEANPFNIAGAIAKCKEIGSTVSTDKYYIKGVAADNYTISESEAGYGNASFDMVDAVGSSDKFKAFQVYGTNGTKLTKGFSLNQGDEVIIYGPIYNYNGKTPETGGKGVAYIVSVNGKPTSDTPTPTPTPTPGGENLLKNGDFEAWTGNTPNNWDGKAGNATLAQSTDKHGGLYAVKVEGATQNKRLSYTQITLKAGTYGIKFFAKAADADGASVRPGYVAILDDGSVDSQNYKYLGEYINDITKTTWVEVTATFTLDAQKTICLVIMNPKDKGSVLIDDYELTTSDGGIVDGGGESGGGSGEGGGSQGGGDTSGILGDGTLANPFNVAGILNVTGKLATGAVSDQDYYFKGKIANIKYPFDVEHGTATFFISDNGENTNTFQVYSTLYLGNKKWADGNKQVALGDEVIICGKVTNYNGTLETKSQQSYIYSLNGVTE